jgi:hypothetical protein
MPHDTFNCVLLLHPPSKAIAAHRYIRSVCDDGSTFHAGVIFAKAIDISRTCSISSVLPSQAMGSRTVDVNWANEHHSLWMEEENGPHRIERDAEATNRDLGGIAIPKGPQKPP